MYTSDTCADCQTAKKFYYEHRVEVRYKNFAEDQNRNELKNKYGCMAVPTIIIEDRVILGFTENKAEVIKLLKL